MIIFSNGKVLGLFFTIKEIDDDELKLELELEPVENVRVLLVSEDLVEEPILNNALYFILIKIQIEILTLNPLHLQNLQILSSFF